MILRDPNNFGKQLENQIDKLTNIRGEDAEAINRFAAAKREEYAPGTLGGYLSKLRRISCRTDMALLDLKAYELQNVVNRMRTDRDWEEGAARNHQKALKSFLRYHGEGGRADEIVYEKVDRTRKVSKDDHLGKDEFEILLQEGSRMNRGRVMFSLLWDTRMRHTA